jgi:DNA topoisomerase-2
MAELEEDIVSLMKKRVYDMAGLFGAKGVKVFLNGDQIKINSFLKYCDMYFPKELNNPIKIYDRDMTTPR